MALTLKNNEPGNFRGRVAWPVPRLHIYPARILILVRYAQVPSSIDFTSEPESVSSSAQVILLDPTPSGAPAASSPDLGLAS